LEKIEKLNRPIVSEEIESEIKNFPSKKGHDMIISLVYSITHFKKNYYQSSSNSSKNLKETEFFQTHFRRLALL
jgi:hypothetical protein